MITQTSPFAVKNAFLRSGREGIVIKEMYGDKFNGVSPNRIKYLTFLKQVEKDGRLEELNDILNKLFPLIEEGNDIPE